MEIESFAELVKDNVKKQLGSGYHVTVCDTDKNNGVVYTGLKVKKDDSDIAPMIYLNDQFKRYTDGDTTLSEITDYVTSVSKSKSPTVDIRKFLDYESVSERIVYKLINTERNSGLLEDIPHMEYLDLSIVFQYLMADGFDNTAFILIHNVHMKLWDVTTEDLFEAAEKNTRKLMGCDMKSMKDVFREIIRQETPEESDNNMQMTEFEYRIPMYVLSNRCRVEGAACMIYPNLLSEICDKLKSSFYIIPSSIHEVLILPSDSTDESREILTMIKDINDTQVSAEEILSYSLYYYDGKECKLVGTNQFV